MKLASKYIPQHFIQESLQLNPSSAWGSLGKTWASSLPRSTHKMSTFRVHFSNTRSRLYINIICQKRKWWKNKKQVCKVYTPGVNFSKKFIQEHNQSVKQFGSRSGPTFCRAWSGSNQFVKVFRRRQKSSLARIEFKSVHVYIIKHPTKKWIL